MENNNNNNNNRISIPVTLKGINYLLWARMVKIALGGKGLWSHVSAEAAPKQTTQGEDGQEIVVATDEDKWAQEDLMVLTVLLSSLEPAIMESYSYCETTKQLWDTLYKVYGNTSNLTRVFEVKRAINTLNQGDMEFQPHFGKFRANNLKILMERLGINLEKEPEKGRDTTPYKETKVHNTEDSHPDHDQPAQDQPEENPVLSHDQDEMGQPDTEAQEGEPSSRAAAKNSYSFWRLGTLLAMEKLKANRDDVHQKMEIAEQRLILCGLCSKSLRSSYRYGELVCTMSKEIADLKAKGGSFERVAGPATTDTMEKKPLDPNIVGQEIVLADAWQKLNTDEVGIMGLYGMGGVGLEMKGQPASQQSNKNMTDRPTQHHGPEALHDGLGTIRSKSQNLIRNFDQFIH
uniref:Retrotransposon Copia-like N-terminal domain-containing protein n=1 Tax=Brassica oleracea var. oleracea TaxID=109376 RepID=A0A0D3C9N9_BRAOL